LTKQTVLPIFFQHINPYSTRNQKEAPLSIKQTIPEKYLDVENFYTLISLYLKRKQASL